MKKVLLSAALFLVVLLVSAPTAEAQNTLCRTKCINGACNFGHDDGYMGDCTTQDNPDGEGTICKSVADDPCVEPITGGGGGSGGKRHFEEDETDNPGGGTMVIYICFGGCASFCTFCG